MDNPMNHRDAIHTIWKEHLRVASLLETIAADVDRAAQLIIEQMRQGHRLLVCGNGGSAADAQHIAAELTGRFLRDRKPLPAMALHANTSSLTAIGNDYGYDEVFAREVGAHGRAGDVLLGISTSGNSKNVIKAIMAARAQGMKVIALTGKANSALGALADVDVALDIGSPWADRVQELHIKVIHILIEICEQELF